MIPLKKGLVVRIKYFKDIPGGWNTDPMPNYIGKVVTIKEDPHTTSVKIKILEDQEDRITGWSWNDDDFQKVNTPCTNED